MKSMVLADAEGFELRMLHFASEKGGRDRRSRRMRVVDSIHGKADPQCYPDVAYD
jgi:hypothetical protein